MVKRWLLIAVALLTAGLAVPAGQATAEEGEIALLHSGADIRDIKSLQRGARDFMNYCSGCHSLTYLRYNRMAEDLKIPEADLKAQLMFTSDNLLRQHRERHAAAMPRTGSASSRPICR